MAQVLADRSLSDVVSSRAAARLSAFRREVERALPGRVVKVVLFGSRARGDAHRGSDYDVAVFLKDLDERRPIDHLLADIAYPHVLAGTHIRPVAVPAGYLGSSAGHPLATSIARDGIAVP